jgi:hypothetical protein
VDIFIKNTGGERSDPNVVEKYNEKVIDILIQKLYINYNMNVRNDIILEISGENKENDKKLNSGTYIFIDKNTKN